MPLSTLSRVPRALLCFGLAACGSSGSFDSLNGGSDGSQDSDGGAGTTQTTPTPSASSSDIVAFSRLTNAIPIQVTVGAATNYAFVDTGNPWTLLDPTLFPGAATLPANGGALASLQIASETASNPYVIPSTSGDLQGDATFSLDGNVGCSVVCSYTPAFNYRDVVLTLGPSTPPSGLEAAVTVPFTFEGGGTEDGVVVPKSRIVVPVMVEGNSYSMILDSGASDVTLSSAAFTALTADGRTQVSGGTAETTSGSSSSSITRAASMSVGGVTVTSLVVAHDTSFDANLASVSTDVGHTIDGSLGGTFLHEFYVTVDYTKQTVSFARYTDLSWVIDPAQHIGIMLGADESTTGSIEYGVASSSGAAAAMGIAAGDIIVAIDGTQLETLTELEISTLTFGPLGSTRTVTFGTNATLSGMTVTLPVEENLPLPTN